MTLTVVFSALLSGASRAGGDYVDVHMHLHPRGLDAAMGDGQGGGFSDPRQGMQPQGMQPQGRQRAGRDDGCPRP